MDFEHRSQLWGADTRLEVISKDAHTLGVQKDLHVANSQQYGGSGEELRGLSGKERKGRVVFAKSKFSGIGNSRMVLNAHHSTTVFRRVC